MIATESSMYSSASLYRKIVILLCSMFFISGCASLKEVYESTFSASEITPDNENTQGERLDSEDLDTLIAQPFIDPITRFIQRNKNNQSMTSQVKAAITEQQKRCNLVTNEFTSSNPDASQVARFTRGYKFSCPIQVSRLQPENESTEMQDQEPLITEEDVTETELDPIMAKQASDCYLLLSINNFTEAKTTCQPLIERGDIMAIEGIAEVAYLEEDYPYFITLAEPVARESSTLAYLMGQVYELGHTVTISLEVAREWYQQAEVLGHTDAKAALANLESLLTQPQ